MGKDKKVDKKKKKQNRHDLIFVLMSISVVMIAAFLGTLIARYFSDAIIEYKEGSIANEHDKQNAENIARILMGVVAVFSMIVIAIFYKDNKKRKKKEEKLRAAREREELKREVERARERLERRRTEAFIEAGLREIRNRRDFDNSERFLEDRDEKATGREVKWYKDKPRIFNGYDEDIDEDMDDEVEEVSVFGSIANFFKNLFRKKDEEE